MKKLTLVKLDDRGTGWIVDKETAWIAPVFGYDSAAAIIDSLDYSSFINEFNADDIAFADLICKSAKHVPDLNNYELSDAEKFAARMFWEGIDAQAETEI